MAEAAGFVDHARVFKVDDFQFESRRPRWVAGRLGRGAEESGHGRDSLAVIHDAGGGGQKFGRRGVHIRILIGRRFGANGATAGPRAVVTAGAEN
jgi:hypothetical protein